MKCDHLKNYEITEFATAQTAHTVENGVLMHLTTMGDFTGRIRFTCTDCGFTRSYDSHSISRRKRPPAWVSRQLKKIIDPTQTEYEVFNHLD